MLRDSGVPVWIGAGKDVRMQHFWRNGLKPYRSAARLGMTEKEGWRDEPASTADYGQTVD
jgi:hypothetical protein